MQTVPVTATVRKVPQERRHPAERFTFEAVAVARSPRLVHLLAIELEDGAR